MLRKYDIVILGGGFCGLTIAQKLQTKIKEQRIILIDRKENFEYVPSLHKLIKNPKHENRIKIPYVKLLKKTEFLNDEIIKVDDKKVITKTAEIYFDYLIVSTGSNYPILLEDKTGVHSLKSILDGHSISNAVKKSKSIIVVGGGIVGTEIAAELSTMKKQITLIDPSSRLLSRLPEKVSAYAQKKLSKNITLLLGERILKKTKKLVITDKETKLESDLIIWCAGIEANTQTLEKHFSKVLNQKKLIKVTEYLQMEGYTNIFVGGDSTAIVEEKTAQNAEKHAEIIAFNLEATLKNKPLKTYKSEQRIMVISLGDWDGLMIYGNAVMGGILPGIIKHLVEIKEIAKFKNHKFF